MARTATAVSKHVHREQRYTGHCLCGAYPSASGNSWFKIEGAIPHKVKFSPETQKIVNRLDDAVREFKESMTVASL